MFKSIWPQDPVTFVDLHIYSSNSVSNPFFKTCLPYSKFLQRKDGLDLIRAFQKSNHSKYLAFNIWATKQFGN